MYFIIVDRPGIPQSQFRRTFVCVSNNISIKELIEKHLYIIRVAHVSHKIIKSAFILNQVKIFWYKTCVKKQFTTHLNKNQIVIDIPNVSILKFYKNCKNI